jgi:asparagine synthase (glutamine-hydrolysing)
MPGIVGVIGLGSPAADADALRRMTKCMLHESFYSAGEYLNAPLGLSVGWVTRSGAFADCMPVWNEARDVCMIFSGEEHSEPSEVEHLRVQGHRFDAGNASYLVHLYEELGDRFFERLNGWFCGLIVDLRQRQLTLFNDRYGLGRIYAHEADSKFYFASEAKALLAVLPTLRNLDRASVAEFVSCGCPLQNRTLFQGITQVPGGSRWTFRPEQPIAKSSYFRRETWEGQEPLGATGYYESLKDVFSRVLPKYLRSERTVAVSLTGGVDSRMVMAWARQPAGMLPTYTFGGMYRDCTDVRIARRVAAICGQQHQVIPVADRFLEEFPSLADQTVYFTDGAMDVSGSPDLYVNRIARGIGPTRLTGNYGGEILRRIVAFKPMSLRTRVFPDLAAAIADATERYSAELTENKLSFVAFKQVPWHHYSRLALEQSQLTLRSPYLDNDLVALSFRAPPELATSNELALRLIADGNPALAAIGTDRGVLHQSVPLVTQLQHLYQEFTFKAEYAYDYGMPQWLARLDRRMRALHLERLFLGRHKFYHFRYWYRTALAPYLKETLLDARSRSRAYLDGAVLERMVRDHTSGNGNFTLEIHRLLSLELIHRTLLERTY